MRRLLAALLAVLLVVVAGPATPASSAPSVPASASAAPADSAPAVALAPIDVSTHLKIMGVGDSITEGGFSCCNEAYRPYLWHHAWEVAHYYTWSYVGPRKTCPTCWSHAGQSNRRLDQMDADLPGWLVTYNPDVVLLHGGIGEVLQGMSGAVALAHLADLLTHALAADADVRIIVGDLMPPWGDAQRDAASIEARRFNAGVLAVVQAAGPRVSLARMSRGVSSRWLGDGLHPLPVSGAPAGDPRGGWSRMAWVWWQCMGPLLTADGVQRGGEDPNEVPVPQAELCPA